MDLFDEAYRLWMQKQINEEANPRRRELLEKGLSHGTVQFLRSLWFPLFRNFDYLYAEFEVRDFNNKYRYLDLAFLPWEIKACIEIHDYRTHARDVEVGRFKDLCMKQAMLALDDWLFLPITYLSIRDDPGLCKQLVLSLVGKFLSSPVHAELNWAESETLRFARRLMWSLTPRELSAHLQLSERHTRDILRSLVSKKLLVVASGSQRYRTYQLPADYSIGDHSRYSK